MDLLCQLFRRLSQTNLTVNLPTSEFGHCQLTFLGHVVGKERFLLYWQRWNQFTRFPELNNKRELMRFWVWLGTIESSATISL